MTPTLKRIHGAAVRLFGERGYPGTSMRDIADSVGVLRGSLYAHITSKEALLLEIVETGINLYLDAIRSCVESDAPADERMASAIHAYLEVLSSNLEQTIVAFEQWKYLTDEPDRKRIVKLRNEYEKLFTTLVDEGIADGTFRHIAEPRITVLAIISLLNAIPQWYSPRGRRGPHQTADALVTLILRGLRPVDSRGCPN